MTDIQTGLVGLRIPTITPRTPAIRSSDLDTAASCPFTYFLAVKCGLRPALRESKALSRGSWVHRCFEYAWLDPLYRQNMLEGDFVDRLTELDTTCRQAGYPPSFIDKAIDSERRHFDSARGWFEVYWDQIPLRDSLGRPTVTLRDWFDRGNFVPLAPEVLACVRADDPRLGINHALVAQYDLLMYEPATNRLHVVDYKTSEDEPSKRLLTVPFSFQTAHYLYVLRRLCQAPDSPLWALFPGLMDRRPEPGSIFHIGLQKPTIDFCSKDRNRGTDGKPYGEPVFANYIERCRKWLMGEGEYLDKKAERESNIGCPIAISAISSESLREETTFKRYAASLQLSAQWASKSDDPAEYPPIGCAIVRQGEVSPYAPFATKPVAYWPTVALETKMRVAPRDNFTAESAPEARLERSYVHTVDPTGHTRYDTSPPVHTVEGIT